MQTNRSAWAATIFSRVKAAPPPLIMQPLGSISSAPSMYTDMRSTKAKSITGIPKDCMRLVEASELDTAPLIAIPLAAKASMNLFTVEPVPTPRYSPGTTYFKAAWATSIFNSSWEGAVWLIGDNS